MSHCLRKILFVIAFFLIGNALHQLSWKIAHFGVILPLILGTAAALIAWQYHTIQSRIRHSRYWLILWRSCWLLTAAWLLSLCVFFVMLHQHAQHSEQLTLAAPPDAILILGSGPPDCRPSPSLQSRLDKGLEIITYIAQKKPSDKLPVVVSGGSIRLHDCTEAQIMGTYLTSHFSSDTADTVLLLKENKSTSTAENMSYSAPLFRANGIKWEKDRIAIVSNHFHLIRATAIARKQGCENCYAAGAPAPAHTRPNIWLREYFAFISGWILSEY